MEAHMTKLLATLGLLGVLLFGCSKSSTVTASPSPTSAASGLGCDFKIPNAVRNRELTKASINEAVAAAPAAIRADLRTVYESSKKYSDDVKAAQAAPQAQRSAMLTAASKDLNNPQYKGASQRLRAYFIKHCTGLRNRIAPSATP
jgi:hypothetical protein